jgi:hypothetical protein
METSSEGLDECIGDLATVDLNFLPQLPIRRPPWKGRVLVAGIPSSDIFSFTATFASSKLSENGLVWARFIGHCGSSAGATENIFVKSGPDLLNLFNSRQFIHRLFSSEA